MLLNSIRSLRRYFSPAGPHRHSAVRLLQTTPENRDNESSSTMEQKEDPKSRAADTNTMSSFGEGYATRSDEEGFGGTYGGNQTLRKEGDKSSDAAGFDHSQGSEVKEKEKARHQDKVD